MGRCNAEVVLAYQGTPLVQPVNPGIAPTPYMYSDVIAACVTVWPPNSLDPIIQLLFKVKPTTCHAPTYK